MSESLQEFLVSLKYKQEGREKFVSDIEGARTSEGRARAIAAMRAGWVQWLGAVAGGKG